jgi:glycine/D-amino acid oxidase-like deaminating enzyme
MRVVAGAFEKKGAGSRIGRAEPPQGAGSTLSRVSLGVARAFPRDVRLRLRPVASQSVSRASRQEIFTPRRDTFFFGTPSGDDRFDHPHLPNFADVGYYGFASIDGRGFKVSPRENRWRSTPTWTRVHNAYLLERARAFLAHRFPDLQHQPLLESRVCQTEMSVDENFIVQKHPQWDNVWIAGGGSGHGFKHGPVIGEYVARRVSGGDEEPELEAVFRIKRNVRRSVFSGARRY